MSRYLTPSKIGLLALISLYSDGVVPSSATIPILSFLISYLLPVHSVGSKQDGITISVDKLQKATIAHTSAIPGRTVWDLLLKQLWMIDSLHALHAFFNDLSLLLEKPPHEGLDQPEQSRRKRMLLSKNSPLGAFVRRSLLEFTRLQFHDGASLWKSLIIYRTPTLPHWKRRNPKAGPQSFDRNLQAESIDADGTLSNLIYGDLSADSYTGVVLKDGNASTDDLERLLDHQINRMQRAGNRIPPAMLYQLRSLARSGVTMPSVSSYVQWYALLNLAILQADFGCFSEAITAMQETIATARENNDMPCLNYSLSWLYQFGRTHPEEMAEIQKKGVLGSEKEALSFLKAKAKESSMWTLLSTTLLSEAKLILSNGDNVSLAFESIVKASHLNVTKNLTEAYGGLMLMQSSTFDRLGVACQAWSHCELFLQCYAGQSLSEDVIQTQCLSASMLARKGQYDEAISRMDMVDPEALRTLRDELDAGDHVLTQLRAAPAGVPELQFNISMLEVHLRIRRNDYTCALALLEQLMSELDQQEADIFQRLKAMILKARVYDQAGIPQKGFSVALRAASLAHKARILPILWEAVGAVGRVLISVKEFEAAVKLMENVLPQALECEDCELTAYLFSCLADGHMGMAGQSKEGTLQRKEKLTKAMASLDRAFEEYSRIKDITGQCEMMAKKATIMHLNGDAVLANDCAAKYLDIKKAAKA
ncbi:MAG: hypothetical protein Q9223_002662 [Gallowayella weberi]